MTRHHVRALVLSAILVTPAVLTAQERKPLPPPVQVDPWSVLLLPRVHKPMPTTAAITAADLKTRLYMFADDSMGGRLLGSVGNYKGVEYIASEAKRFGLQPAGQDGSFFQNVPVEERRFDDASVIAVDGKSFTPWTDYIPRDPLRTLRSLDNVPVIWGGVWSDSNSVITNEMARGKIVVISSTVSVPPNPPGIPSRPAVNARFKDAAGIVVIGLDNIPENTRAQYRTGGGPQLRGSPGAAGDAPAYLYVTKRMGEALLGASPDGLAAGAAGKTLTGSLQYKMSQFGPKPARNVVALLPGSDPTLRAEYVVIGAHNDHIGTVADGMSDTQQPQAHDSTYIVDHLYRLGGADEQRPQLTPEQQRKVNSILADVRKRSKGASARLDSIFNGADDDGTGSMSLLEIAQYLAAQPVKPKRSILFVWHVGEELGLYGSQWFTDHPTVPRENIVAELNMDMVGRGATTDETGNSIDKAKLHGGKGYVQVVGSRRLSTELGDIVEAVNKSGAHGLHFDYGMDANGHPQNIYCRSDHYEYARYGIPIAFFTTGGHADYHQVTDEPQYIDYAKMAQVDNFVADLAKHAANLGHRPLVDKAKPDPQGVCQQ